MNARKIFAWLTIPVYFGIFYFVYSQDPLSKIGKGVVYLIPVFFLFFASLNLFLKAKTTSFSRSSIFFLLASASLLIAEVWWTILDITISGAPPYPSIPDVFYLSSYLILFLGVLAKIKMENLNLRSSVFAITSVVLFILIAITFYFGILQAYDIEASLLLNIVNLLYGVADMIVLVVGLLVLNTAFTEKAYIKGWLLFAFSMVSTWVGDLIYSFYFTEYNERVFPYILMDVSWVLWYLLLGFSFINFASDKLEKPEQASPVG